MFYWNWESVSLGIIGADSSGSIGFGWPGSISLVSVDFDFFRWFWIKLPLSILVDWIDLHSIVFCWFQLNRAHSLLSSEVVFFCLLELALSIFIYSFISFLFAELELVGHGHWFWMKVSFISIELISSIWMRIDFADFKRISLIVIELRFLISNNLGFTNWATFIDFGQTVATRSGLMEVEEYQDTFFPVVIYDTEF